MTSESYFAFKRSYMTSESYFAFKRSYMTSEVIKSVLVMLVPGSFQNIDH